MSMDLSILSGEQLLMMSILGVIDQDIADVELDRRAMQSAPSMDETIESLLSRHVSKTSKRKHLGNAA